MLYHTTKAELFNLSNRNNNGPGEAEDVQHGSDHSLDSDDKKTFLPPHNGFNGNKWQRTGRPLYRISPWIGASH